MIPYTLISNVSWWLYLLYLSWMSFSYFSKCYIYWLFFFWKYFYFDWCCFDFWFYGSFTPFRNFPYKVAEGLMGRLVESIWFFQSPWKRVIAKFLLGDKEATSFLWWLNGLFDCLRTLKLLLFSKDVFTYIPGKLTRMFLFDILC